MGGSGGGGAVAAAVAVAGRVAQTRFLITLSLCSGTEEHRGKTKHAEEKASPRTETPLVRCDKAQRSYARAATASCALDPDEALFTSSGFPPALRMSMPPLKKAPSSIEMRAATTSPVSDPSLRISTPSLAG